MKRNRTVIAGLVLAAGISSIAFAQPGRGGSSCEGMAPWGMGPIGRHAGMKFDPAQRAERHLAILKSELKISGEQESLWQAFAEKMKAEAGKGLAAMRTQASDEKLTAPERMEKMLGLMQERLTAMQEVKESFNRLYAALTPEQKATADRHVARMGRFGGGRKGGMGSAPKLTPPVPPAPQG